MSLSFHVERVGQTEIATMTHNGHEFTALGASVVGRHITAYVKPHPAHPRWRTVLTTFEGRTILDARSEVIETYRANEFGDTGQALLIRLTHGRFIAGYSLGDGSLFRGELIDGMDDDDAKREAIATAEYWLERDAEDAERFQAELDAEDEQEDDDDTDDAE